MALKSTGIDSGGFSGPVEFPAVQTVVYSSLVSNSYFRARAFNCQCVQDKFLSFVMVCLGQLSFLPSVWTVVV